jgi:CubicO group peptidase (beta-lactamase class C family)
MDRREFTGLLATLATSPFVLRGQEAAPSAGTLIKPPSDAALAHMRRLMEIGGVPGVAAGIVTPAGLSWHRLEGVVDVSTRQPVDMKTMFPAASLGKPVFAHLVLRLADEGRIDLDKPLKSYLADHTPADPRGDKITARHVLAHSTGLRNWRNSPEQPLVPEFDPGNRFQYSGEGFYYLQRVVETIASNGVEQVAQDRLFAPLGMKSSTYVWRDDTRARLWTGHSRGNPQRDPSRDFAERLLEYARTKGKPLATFTHSEIVTAMTEIKPAPRAVPITMVPNVAASLLTTLEDYATYLKSLLQPVSGPTELKHATRQAMTSPQTRINSVLSWGLGWGLEADAGREYLWQWGDNGTFKNFVLAHLPTRTAIVVFTNGSSGLRIAEHLIASATGHDHLAFDWL